MNWIGNLRNWFVRLSDNASSHLRGRTSGAAVEPGGQSRPQHSLFRHVSSSPDMPAFTDGLTQETATQGGPRPSFVSLPQDATAGHQHLAAIMKEYSLLLWTLDFKNPTFPAADETRSSETSRQEHNWSRDHLVPGWEVLQRWLLHPALSGDESESGAVGRSAPPGLPMWYIHPSGQLLLDESMTAANTPVPGHRLVILLSRSPDQLFLERTGRHLSETNLQPVLLAGPAILRQIPSHGDYFLPSCTEITFLLDQADYSVTNHAILNAMRHQMSLTLSIPTTLEFTHPVNTPTAVSTPTVETDRPFRIVNPWFPSRDQDVEIPRRGQERNGYIRVFPPPSPPAPSSPGKGFPPGRGFER